MEYSHERSEIQVYRKEITYVPNPGKKAQKKRGPY
jgi:hypothetical protein